MNKNRRERLKESLTHLAKAEDIISRVADEENDSMNNYPENLQYSDTYRAIESAVEYLEDAQNLISEASESINSAINGD